MIISNEQKEFVLSVIRRHAPPDTEVYFFGSRVNDTANKTSDLDVLLRGNSSIELSLMSLMKEEFEESDLPFKVDLLDYNSLSERMVKNISSNMIRIS